jgi:CheY-like chemotaxis protein
MNFPASNDSPSPPVGQRKGKILMVDDSDVVLEMGAIILEEAGYEVVTLDNPLSVAYALRKQLPDLLLIDVNMPALTGDAVTKIVSHHGAARRIPVILYSDISIEELSERARLCGALGYIRKTNDEAEFVRKIDYWLARSRAEQTRGVTR